MAKFILLLLGMITFTGCHSSAKDLSKHDQECAVKVYEAIQNNKNKGMANIYVYRVDFKLKKENQVLTWDDPEFNTKVLNIEAELPGSVDTNYNLVTMAKVDDKLYGDGPDQLREMARETTFYKSCVSYLENFETNCKGCVNPTHKFQGNVNNYMNMTNGTVDFTKFKKENYTFLYYKD